MKNTLFNASAGTGKTYKLTDVYIKLITEFDVDPNKIILMTFSKNTASELKSEVLKKLSNLKDEKINKSQLFQKIESAQICTMDSFCSNVLKKNSINIGVNLNFQLFDDENVNNVLNEICHKKLMYFIKENLNFSLFCEQMNLDISSQYSNSTVPGRAKSLIIKAQGMGISLENCKNFIQQPIDINLEQIQSVLYAWDINEKSLSSEKKIKAQLINVIKKSDDLHDFVRLITMEDRIDRRPKFGKCMAELIDQAIYKINHPNIIAFAEYVSLCYQDFQHYKDINALLTYDDIKYYAVEILEKKLSQIFYKYIIIDEVQDSSELQHRLINSLWKNDSTLIACGDQKQCIYGWRDADPNIMNSLKQEINNRNGNIEPLQESWRSKKNIINPVNKIFENIVFDKSGISKSLKNKLCYANYEEEKLISNEKINANINESYSIECLLPKEESSSKTNETEAEMSAIAKRISLLINSNDTEKKPAYRYNQNLNKFQKVSNENKYQYSDVLILLRTKKNLATLQEKLKKENIPYIFHGSGRGLFSSMPARDISLLLNILCDPNDNLSNVGFLRSPWVNYSDEEIVDKILNKKTVNILDHFEEIYNEIKNSRKDLSKKLLSEIVREWIDKRNYDAIISALPNSDIQINNLKKIIDWIRENERGVTVSPGYISRKLRNYIQNPPKMNESAPLCINQNAVNIMTIHSSKGLTKRIVFIPELNKDSKSNDNTIFLEKIHDQPSIHLKINLSNNYSIISPNYLDADTKRKDLKIKEDINLFYVAMTRARDLIVLSINKKHDKPKYWFKYIDPLLVDKKIKIIHFNDLNEKESKIIKENKCSLNSDIIFEEMKDVKKLLKNHDFTRVTTTSLSQSKSINHNISNVNSINKGNLGHAVLEIAAQKKWQINVELHVKRLLKKHKLNINDASGLIKLINETIIYMKKETSSNFLISEFPFLLKKETQLIDGIIDLITINKNIINIYDYKFSNDSPENLKIKYHQQIKIYNDALKASDFKFDRINCFLISISEKGVGKIKVPV